VNFTAPSFILFFIVFLIIFKFRILPKTLLILIGSYTFYAFWDWRFVGLLILLSLVNFVAGLIIYNQKDIKRKLTLFFALAFNISILALFKYFNFFLDGVANLLLLFKFQVNLPTLEILVPLGISFYIFQISSYVIDIYRGQLLPTKNIVLFSAFGSYFPHMAAGPIMPARLLIPQLIAPYRSITSQETISGISLFANGLFRKIVIADTLAPMVNRVFESPSAFDWKILVAATIAFGLQIYGDFSGYSNMARGISRLLGIELIVNFRQPYFSPNIQVFWRSWHISLSTWFRDYLYVPLGGNKSKRFIGTARNLLVVMVIAGLWHGAAIGFLLWGLLHGLALITYHYWIKFEVVFNRLYIKLLVFFIGLVLTNVFVFLMWIPFRLPEIDSLFNFINLLLNFNRGVVEIPDFLLVLEMLLLTLLTDLFERAWTLDSVGVRSYVVKRPILYGALAGILITFAVLFRSSQVVPFVYFQF
jgi:alginate O-acetyltransferase complex protein AlgI